MTYDGRTRVVVMAEPRAGAIEIVMRDLPALRDGEALVKIRCAGVCGTDLHLIAWNDWAAARYSPPFALGHELCGEIVDIAPNSGFSTGDRVSAETHWACGACRQCRIGRGHTCENLRTFSRLDQGAWADYAVLPLALLRRAPSGLDDETVSVMEPVGIAVRAARESGCPGRALLVSGCGPIGQFAIAAAKALGSQAVIASDPSRPRRALARRLGADIVLDPSTVDVANETRAHTGGAGVAAAIETSGVAPALAAALQAVEPGGRVICAGLPESDVPIDLTGQIVLREVSLHGVYGRVLDRTWLDVEALLTGPLEITAALTHRFPLDRVEEAVAAARSGAGGKVLMTP